MNILIQNALEFASEKHKNQTRKGTGLPYFVHITDVFKILHEIGADKPTLVAAILHDTLEDTNTTINELVEKFGIDIAFMVDTLSEKKSLPYDERKHLQALRIGNSTKEIKLIKCADCLANLMDSKMQMDTPNFWGKFNAPKEAIKKHYKETIEAISELQETTIYERLKKIYNEVFALEVKKNTGDCTDCSHMKRIRTPDPYDWFCDDDEEYVCGITNQTLSQANRPYEKQPKPSDCPLIEK